MTRRPLARSLSQNLRLSSLNSTVFCAVAIHSAALIGCGQAPPSPEITSSASTEQAQGLATKCSKKGNMLSGVDVSTYQGTAIDWETVQGAGNVFAIAKVSEGITVADGAFATNWAGIQNVGMVRGAYHFFHPADDPTEQVNYMLNLINDAGGFQYGDLPPILDVEITQGYSAKDIVASLQTAIGLLTEETGMTPIVYSSPDFWQNTLGDPSVNATLWIANYDVSCPELPNAFGDWAFWQNSGTAQVAGIPGEVDTDWFNGSVSDLEALGYGA